MLYQIQLIIIYNTKVNFEIILPIFNIVAKQFKNQFYGSKIEELRNFMTFLSVFDIFSIVVL